MRCNEEFQHYNDRRLQPKKQHFLYSPTKNKCTAYEIYGIKYFINLENFAEKDFIFCYQNCTVLALF